MTAIPLWLDLLAPPACALCAAAVDGEADRLLCAACRQALRGAVAVRRVAGWPRGSAWALAPYGGCMRRAVKRLKYEGRYALGPWLGELLGAELARLGGMSPELVTAVPLHWRRRWTRGYNQAARLAAGVARRLALPRLELLRKVQATPSQVGRSRARRRAIPAGVFCADAAAAGRRVLVVDDVWTTGTTVQACRAALLAAGAAQVWVAAVAYAGTGGDA